MKQKHIGSAQHGFKLTRCLQASEREVAKLQNPGTLGQPIAVVPVARENDLYVRVS
jgi:hypothetical protein